MRVISLQQLLDLQSETITRQGGLPGVRDLGLVESALAQPLMSFGGEEPYPTLEEKIAALGYSLLKSHAFADGNKRIAFVAMAVSARLNGKSFQCDTDEAERMILDAAASVISREQFSVWVQAHLQPLPRSATT